MDFIDPHFHIWDVTSESSGHSDAILGSCAKTYLPTDYLQDLKLQSLTLKKAVFIEAISDKPSGEVAWVNNFVADFEARDVSIAVVAYADFTDPKCSDLIANYAENSRVRGIRQILNHHPTNPSLTWPKVAIEYLHSTTWRENAISLLKKFNLSFDLQLNPHQIDDAIEHFIKHTNTPVIVNHMACLHLEQGEEADLQMLATWRKGIQDLAKFPKVYMKISMLPFVIAQFHQKEETKKQMKELILETIKVFGTDRCMFCSNFPTDKPSIDSQTLYQFFNEVVSEGFTTAQKTDLFFLTADRVYFSKSN